MDFDALVFDLDGTLWDVTEACAVGWNDSLQSLGITKTVTVDDIRRVVGKPTPVCVEILFPEEKEYHQKILEVLGKFEKAAIRSQGGKFYDYLLETLNALSRRYGLYLVSNCQRWYLDLFFELSGTRRFFKGSDCFGNSRRNKPEMLRNLKQEQGFIRPAYIGDTDLDEEAARKAGYAFIYAGYGFGKAKAPDLVINSLKDLMMFVDKG
mgnify:CR=1 FL=1